MNFANLSPAERMKAFGLVGLIIIALFFGVHMLLGAVAPKKTQSPAGATTAPGVPGPPPPAGATQGVGQQAPPLGADAFPLDKAVASSKQTHAELERSVQDPFVQIREPDPKAGLPGGKPQPAEPKVEIHSASGSESFGAPRSGGLPGLGDVRPMGGVGAGPAVLAAVPVEPEIKVVGIVKGDPPLATLSVGGLIQIARPGDVLAKGYRLMEVTEEGVVVRHGRDRNSLRVGGSMNSAAPK